MLKEYIDILWLNDVPEDLSLIEAEQIENGLFTFKGEMLNYNSRIKYEILSLRRRLIDYSAENIGNDENFDDYLNVIEETLESGEYEKAKYGLVRLAYKLKAPTRFYTVLFNLKNLLYSEGYNYTRMDDDYGYDNDFGRKKK